SFRNGNVVASDYTVIGSKVYNTVTGMQIQNPLPHVQKRVDELKAKTEEQLTASDHILIKDLLRFYTPEQMVNAENTEYEYLNQLDEVTAPIKQPSKSKTSLLYKNNNQSTQELYKTDAPELMDEEEEEQSEEETEEQMEEELSLDESPSDNPVTAP